MFKRIKSFFKRWSKRLYVKYRNLNQRNSSLEEVEISRTQKICMSITRSMITHPDSEFLIAPVSGKRYIKNDTLDLFVVIQNHKLSITNHVYHYDVVVSDRNWERLIKMYDGKVEIIRQEFEDQIMSQIVHSLDQIKSKFAIK
jgi:hypothetical protein